MAAHIGTLKARRYSWAGRLGAMARRYIAVESLIIRLMLDNPPIAEDNLAHV